MIFGRAMAGLGFAASTAALTAFVGPALSANSPTALDTPPTVVVTPPDINITPKEVTSPRVREQERVPSGNPLWAIPLSSLTATRERPLFRPSRRPPPPAVAGPPRAEPVVAPPPPSEPERPQLTLVGAIAGETEGIAIFIDLANNNAVVRLHTGQGHAGWVLNSVKGREVTLQKKRETAVLVLPGPGAAGVPGVPVVTGAVPIVLTPTVPGATPPAVRPGDAPSDAVVAPSNPADFAPYTPRHTPKNGESDGL